MTPTPPQDTELEKRIIQLEQTVELLKSHIHTVDLLNDMADPAAETTPPLVGDEDNEGREIWRKL
jgi:hypothetical protein